MARTYTLTRNLTAWTLLIGTAACGGGDGTDQSSQAPEAAPAAAVENPATLIGEVLFTGTAPQGDPIDMSEEPTCAEKHDDPPVSDEVVVNDGRLKNVFVYVRDGLTGTHAVAGEQVVIDQDGCVYSPHVAGVQTGQELVFRNSDGLLHNIKAQPTNNRPFNISQPTNMTSNQTFNQPEVMVPVQCDVHGWMNMYIGVTNHPYFAVSAADGTFTIANVPPGTYTIETWHEQYGTQTQQVTVAESAGATADFTYSAAMAANAVVPLADPIDLHDHTAAPSAGTR